MTSEAPGSTIYAVCSDSNILGSYRGRRIDIVIKRSNAQLVSVALDIASGVPSAADCCVRCATTSGCTGSVYPSGGAGSGLCYLLHNQARSRTSQSDNEVVFTLGGGDTGFTLSNGLCGYQQFLGNSN